MAWIDDAKKRYKELDCFEEERKHNLRLDDKTDLPEDFSGITRISFGYQSERYKARDVLPYIIKKSPGLKSISIINEKISWKELCEFDFSNIEEISIHLKDNNCCESLNAPLLKKLIIFSDKYLMPIELPTATVPKLNLSNTPLLECLELRHFQLVNPKDFSKLSFLKRLVITESYMENLDWMKEATYELESFYYDGMLDNCNGIIYQPSLKQLIFSNPWFSDISSIEALPNLESLDLRYSNFIDEGNIRKKVKKFLLTQQDSETEWIKREVYSILDCSVSEIRSEDKKASNLESIVPEIRRNIFIKYHNQPFETKLQQKIQRRFTEAVQKIKAPDNKRVYTESRDQYLKKYYEEATRYYPFLVVDSK